MEPIKFYGESKTGTTYLQKLLELNVDAKIIPGDPDSPLGWKHGFPQAGDATYIFIFRNIYEWAKSLKSDTIDKRFNGIVRPFGNIDERDYQDHWKTWDNPIECRTAKYYSYIGFAELYGGLMINLDYMRRLPVCIADLIDHGYEMKHYEGNKNIPVIKDVESHAYKDVEGRDNPDRQELTEQERYFIDSHKDPTLEQWVDNLTIYG